MPSLTARDRRIWEPYNQSEFSARYLEYRMAESSPNRLAEQPFIRAGVGRIGGARVLDIGCGYGDFCRFTAKQGAAMVVGIDASWRMIEIAVEMTPAELGIKFRCSPVQTASFPYGVFDVVVASMVLHYVDDLQGVLSAIAAWTRLHGRFAFSINDPEFTAKLLPANDGSSDGRFRNHSFLGSTLTKVHRSLFEVESALRAVGFHVDDDACLSDGLIRAFVCTRRF